MTSGPRTIRRCEVLLPQKTATVASRRYVVLAAERQLCLSGHPALCPRPRPHRAAPDIPSPTLDDPAQMLQPMLTI